MFTNLEKQTLLNYKRQKKGAPTIAKLMNKLQEEVETELMLLKDVELIKQNKKIKAEKIIHDWWFVKKVQNIPYIAEQTGISPIEVAEIIRNLQLAVPQNTINRTITTAAGYTDDEAFVKKNDPIFWDKKQEPTSAIDLIMKLESLRRTIKAYDTEQASCTVQLPGITSDWIAFVPIGDLHIGSSETDVTQILADFQMFAQTPNVFVGFTGDATDNWTKSLPLGIHEQLISPEGQRLIFRELIKIIQHKLLFMVHGCHDNFSITNDDFNLIKEVAKEVQVPYLGYGGKAEILINGDVLYKGTYWHKRPGASQNNIFQPCIKTLLTRCDNDIVAVGHHHVSAAMMYDFQGRNVALLRTGSYKAADRFAKKLGHGPVHDTEYKRTIPCVLLNTKHKEIRIAHSFDEGIDMLNYLNGTQKPIVSSKTART